MLCTVVLFFLRCDPCEVQSFSQGSNPDQPAEFAMSLVAICQWTLRCRNLPLEPGPADCGDLETKHAARPPGQTPSFVACRRMSVACPSMRPHSETRKVLDFLMEHPRRCFTPSWPGLKPQSPPRQVDCCEQVRARHMFPAVHTMWLMLVIVGLNVLGTIVILIQVPLTVTLQSCESRGRTWVQMFRTSTARLSRGCMPMKSWATPCSDLRCCTSVDLSSLSGSEVVRFERQQDGQSACYVCWSSVRCNVLISQDGSTTTNIVFYLWGFESCLIIEYSFDLVLALSELLFWMAGWLFLVV